MKLTFSDLTRLAVADGVPAEIRNFSQAQLRAPSFAAGIKGAEELLDQRPESVKFLNPFQPPDSRVPGTTSENMPRSEGSTREFSGSTKEDLPANVTVAKILERNRNIWAQGPVAPATANAMEGNLLRSMNDANRKFWEAR